MKLQYDASRSGISGQDVAAILGISRNRTALEIWCEKTGRISPKERTEAPELDEALLAWYVKKEGVEVAELPSIPFDPTERTPRLAQPDLFVRNWCDDLWNVNAVHVAWDAAELWGDPQNCEEVELPADEFWRGAHENHVLGVHRTDFVVMVAGAWPPKVYHVVDTTERYEAILPTLAAFWKLVQDGTEPPADFAHQSTLSTVRRMHSVNRRIVADLSPADGALVIALDGLKELGADVDAAIAAVKARLLSAVGDAWKGVDASTGATVLRRLVRVRDGDPYARMTTSLPKNTETRTQEELLRLVKGIAANRGKSAVRVRLNR